MAVKSKKVSVKEDKKVNPDYVTPEGGFKNPYTPLDRPKISDSELEAKKRENLAKTKSDYITDIVKTLSGMRKEDVVRFGSALTESDDSDEDDKKEKEEIKEINDGENSQKKTCKESEESDEDEDKDEKKLKEESDESEGDGENVKEEKEKEDSDEDEDDLKEEKEESEDSDEDGDDEDEEKLKEQLKLKKEDLQIRYDVSGIFEGHNFTPEFKEKAREMFATAVLAAVNENLSIVAKNEIAARKKTKLQIENKLAKKMDKYLEYMAEQYMEENKLAIENGITVEIAESFMNGMKTLFKEHNITVPESKRDLFAEMSSEKEKLNKLYTKELTKNIQLKEELDEAHKLAVIEEESRNLAETEKSKLISLAETVNFINKEHFTAKVRDLKKTFIGESATPVLQNKIITETKTTQTSDATDPIENVFKRLSRKSY